MKGPTGLVKRLMPFTERKGRFLPATSSAPSVENKPLSGTQHGIPMKERSPVAKTKAALQIINSITGDDPELQEMIEEESIHAHVARLI